MLVQKPIGQCPDNGGASLKLDNFTLFPPVEEDEAKEGQQGLGGSKVESKQTSQGLNPD